MKLKYRNITVPYKVFDQKENFTYYIYKDKKYKDLNKLFTDFLGVYLTYHFEVKGNLKEVHNIVEVVEALLKNKDTFKIPKKYLEEYNEREYKYLFDLQKQLLNDKLKIQYNRDYEFKYSKKEFGNKKYYNFSKEVYEKYRNVKIPKKIKPTQYENEYYVVAGRAYERIVDALGEVYDGTFYYQFGGTKNQNNRTHFHTHDFEDLIWMIFTYSSKFKIHVFQRQYYSKQQLEFLTKLSEKLKEMKFHSVESKMDTDVEEYFYLKDNKKYLKLLIHNIKYYFADKKLRNEILKSHKI